MDFKVYSFVKLKFKNLNLNLKNLNFLCKATYLEKKLFNQMVYRFMEKYIEYLTCT